MDNWLIAAFLKPFVLLVFFLFVWAISRLVYKLIPEGKIKRALFSPLPGHRKR